MKKAAHWIPYVGLFLESTVDENYLADPKHMLRFLLSAVWHGVWFISIPYLFYYANI